MSKNLLTFFLSTNPPKILADNLTTFFDEKVQKLHDGGVNKIVDASVVVPDSENLTSHSLSNIHRLSEDDVHILLNSMPSKSCPLDPMPTSLVKQCSDELLPIITKIINSLLSAGYFPSYFKTAEVILLLKKSTLDPESLQSYRSVSNLKFISKATEKLLLNNFSTTSGIMIFSRIFRVPIENTIAAKLHFFVF